MQRKLGFISAAPWLYGLALIAAAGHVSAQLPYDPPTSIKPPPNVMILLDATRTNLINGGTCRGVCHTEAAQTSGEYSATLQRFGDTRFALARRVLTGGYGWNTPEVDSMGGSADAAVRNDGVMDTYKVRWGVSFYDGLGTRIALEPTNDNEGAQKAVIDFGATPNDNYGYMPPMDLGMFPPPQLNSWVPYWRTTRLLPGMSGPVQPNQPTGSPYSPYQPQMLPWFTETANASSRMGRALDIIGDYWQPSLSPAGFSSPTGGSSFFPAYPAPNDGVTVDGDAANAMESAAPAGCRRNITILMSDGLGGDGARPAGDAAQRIYDLPGPSGALPQSLRNMVVPIHFGIGASAALNDAALRGSGGFLPTAFEGAPGGQITDLSPMRAAFDAVLGLPLSGHYMGAAPTVTRGSTRYANTYFTVQDCSAGNVTTCNIGRPGHLEWYAAPKHGMFAEPLWDAGKILQGRLSSDRNLFTTPPAIETGAATEMNCGALATCAQPTAQLVNISDQHGWGSNGNFIRADPTAQFANGVQRGAANNSADNNYKLADVANSRVVIVGAPAGLGEDLERWKAFLNLSILRTTPNGTFAGGAPRDYGGSKTVKTRDQVAYVGGNDGFLHAFLTGVTSKGVKKNGHAASYHAIGTPCSVGPLESASSLCDGLELWGYSPRFLQPNWPLLRSGHYFMVDGTPVVEDVLFTKRRASPGPVCTPTAVDCGWEYRTVLLECVGAGGPGCVAMDVTNPWAPQLLWERQFQSAIPGKSTATSRPQIGRVKNIVGGTPIPYYVGLMGSGLGGPGHFIAVGIEDGVVFSTLDTSTPAAEADFAGAPTCLDADNDGFVDTCYSATTTGSIYKIRLGGGNPDASTGGGLTMVKFFDARLATGSPSITTFGAVLAASNESSKVNLLFSTGDQESIVHSGEQNYAIKLVDSGPAGPLTPFDAVNPATSHLWNVDRYLTSCTAAADGLTPVGGASSGIFQLTVGEKAIFDPVISNGTVFFTTYTPNPNPCLSGQGYLYGLRFDTCNDGLKYKPLTPDHYTGRFDLGPGLSSVITERHTVIVSTLDTQAPTVLPRPQPVPMLKLWWREVMF